MNSTLIKEQVSQYLSQANVIQAMINKSCSIDFGIIKEVTAEGVVLVAISVATDLEDEKIITCVYANIASKAFTLNVVPTVGDKVIVFYPKRYSSEMFELENKDIIIDKYGTGANLVSGIAVPLNQYKKEGHNNVVTFDDGSVDIKMSFNDGNLFDLVIDKDGNVALTSKGTTLSVQSDVITVDNGKAKIKVDTGGNISIDAMDGKISVKNNQASLFTLLNGMLQVLNTTLQTQGSPALHTVIPNQFTQQVTDLSNLLKE